MREIQDFKAFVPSNDFALSKAFYEHIGFKINWSSEEVAEIDTGFGFRFLLLPANHNNFAHSLMLHVQVNSAQEWYDHFVEIKMMEKFPGTKVAKPEKMPWGTINTHVWDPAGVLLHFSEKVNSEE